MSFRHSQSCDSPLTQNPLSICIIHLPSPLCDPSYRRTIIPILWINNFSDNIRYNLLRTGSVEVTTNKILERGFLDAVRTTSSSFPPCDPLSCLHSPAATRLPYPLPTEPHPTTRRSPQSISGAWTTKERLRVSDFTVSITRPREAR